MLETKRLLLRPIEAKDSKAVFEYRSDAKENQYQGFIPKDIKEVDAFIARNPKEFNQPESWFQIVVIEKDTRNIIGDIGIHFIGNDGFQCELGCTINKEHQGKGFATEAMECTIDYLFNSLHKHRIIGSVDPENTSSIHLLERLHFRKEAHFKESLFLNEKWVDDVIYGLLNKEWRK